MRFAVFWNGILPSVGDNFEITGQIIRKPVISNWHT